MQDMHPASMLVCMSVIFFGCIEILYMCHLHKEAAQTLQRLHAMLFLQVADRFHEFVAYKELV